MGMIQSKWDLQMYEILKKNDEIMLTSDFVVWGNFIPKGTTGIVKDFHQNGIDLHSQIKISNTNFIINLWNVKFKINSEPRIIDDTLFGELGIEDLMKNKVDLNEEFFDKWE